MSKKTARSPKSKSPRPSRRDGRGSRTKNAAENKKLASGRRGDATKKGAPKRLGSNKGAEKKVVEKRNLAKVATNKSRITEKKAVVPVLPSKAYFVEIDENHAGQRLDNFLITHLKGVPKTHIYRIIRIGDVRINKGRCKQTSRLELGDSVRIPPIRVSDNSLGEIDGAKYQFLNKAILFEDDALLVLNKPSGMAVHAGSGIKIGVIEALRALRTDLKYLELVHRLDRETSGCLVLAKKSSALKTLHEDFKTNSLKNPRLDKRYLALVEGRWKHGQRRVTKALNTNAKRHGERIVVVDPDGSYASSIMTPKLTGDTASLIEVKLLTGRTHQVRVHTQSENHSVAGDQKYGEREFNKRMKSYGLSRLFLHAAKLTFFHPINGRSTTIEAPLPSELLAVLNNLALDPNQID